MVLLLGGECLAKISILTVENCNITRIHRPRINAPEKFSRKKKKMLLKYWIQEFDLAASWFQCFSWWVCPTGRGCSWQFLHFQLSWLRNRMTQHLSKAQDRSVNCSWQMEPLSWEKWNMYCIYSRIGRPTFKSNCHFAAKILS